MAIPPPPPPKHGTPEWGRWAIVHGLPPHVATVVGELVTLGLEKPYACLSRTRMPYAVACHVHGWDGPTAKLVWDILVAIVKAQDDVDNDIPF